MDSQNPLDSEPPNEKDKGLLRVYGKIPTRGDLLHHQLEGRKYFDSGDFALSQAHKPSNTGVVKTGSEHPLRDKISHPFSPIPSSSNVDDHANQQLQGQKNTDEVKHGSGLHEEIVPENGTSPGGSEKAKQGKESSDVGCNPASQIPK